MITQEMNSQLLPPSTMVDGPTLAEWFGDENMLVSDPELKSWIEALEKDFSTEQKENQRRDINTAAADAAELQTKRRTKKEQIVELFQQGITDLAEIVYQIGARPSYVAQVLQDAGLMTGYFDLYTTTTQEQNFYSRFFRNVLAFKTVEAARKSVERLDRLYQYFDRLGDRAGQHHAMVMALTGKNRARWSGKTDAAKVFSDWLATH